MFSTFVLVTVPSFMKIGASSKKQKHQTRRAGGQLAFSFSIKVFHGKSYKERQMLTSVYGFYEEEGVFL